jgi:hypothetical protein
MKKLFAIMSAVLALAACSKGELAEIEEQKQDNAASNPVTFNITVDDMGTKALKTEWADGDVIYIKFNGIDTKFMTITYNGSTWVAQAYDNASTPQTTTFEVSDFSGISDDDKKLGAIHYPVAVNASLDGEGNLNFSKNAKNPSVYCLSQKAVTYMFDGTNVNITLSLEKPQNMVLFHINGIGANASDYTLQVTNSASSTCTKAPGSNRITSATYIETVGSSLALGDPIPGFADTDGVIFSVWINKSHLGSDKNWTFKVIGPNNEYSKTITTTLTAGKQYSLPELTSKKWKKKYNPVTINSSGDKVSFAPGNLQYQATTNTWRFAPNQWDAIGNDNQNVAEDYSGWIDMFAWGTSGYNHGATCYQPWNHSSSKPGDYYAYGVKGNSLSDGDGRADWGYNAISNFGNVENDGWRTLSMTEWLYICNTRSDDWRYTMAEINTDGTAIKGVILFPDGFDGTAPTGVTFGKKNTNTNWTTKCTTSGWKALETAGCAFLPVTGYRVGTSVSYAESRGFYWASNTSDNDAYQFKFSTDYGVTSGLYYRYAGLAVRLVKDYK